MLADQKASDLLRHLLLLELENESGIFLSIYRYARHITCIIWSNCTSRRKRATSADTVVVSFDGHKVPPKTPVVFSVQPDPVVSTVNTYRPRTSDSQQLETFVRYGSFSLASFEVPYRHFT